MRPRHAARGADSSNHLTLFDHIAHDHINPIHVQKAAGKPVPVIKKDETALKIHIGLG
jgi:hypothetical protein